MLGPFQLSVDFNWGGEGEGAYWNTNNVAVSLWILWTFLLNLATCIMFSLLQHLLSLRISSFYLFCYVLFKCCKPLSPGLMGKKSFKWILWDPRFCGQSYTQGVCCEGLQWKSGNHRKCLWQNLPSDKPPPSKGKMRNRNTPLIWQNNNKYLYIY